MKKLSETLTELGIAFSFPIEIKDDKGNRTYCEASDGYWYRYEYDANGNPTYCEEVFPEYLEFSKSELPDMIHKIK